MLIINISIDNIKLFIKVTKQMIRTFLNFVLRYVENLAFAVTQDLLRMLFCQFGVCVECKIIRGVSKCFVV